MMTLREYQAVVDANAWRWPALKIYADPIEWREERIRLQSYPDPPPLNLHKVIIESIEFYAFDTFEYQQAMKHAELFDEPDGKEVRS